MSNTDNRPLWRKLIEKISVNGYGLPWTYSPIDGDGAIVGETGFIMEAPTDEVGRFVTLSASNLASLAEALRPLAELDLTGVKGDTVYQRDNTKIMVADVVAAREALKNIS